MIEIDHEKPEANMYSTKNNNGIKQVPSVAASQGKEIHHSTVVLAN